MLAVDSKCSENPKSWVLVMADEHTLQLIQHDGVHICSRFHNVTPVGIKHLCC
jgi:hypothetical protein